MADIQTILLVDDSELILELLEEQLSNLFQNPKFIRAENGQAALDRCETMQFDLIITDIVMPKVDGLEMIESLRQRSESALKTSPSCPVLIVSSYIDRGVYEFANQHAPCMILRKPFSMQHLDDQLRSLLDGSKR